jgi:hypothetical protein
MEESSVKEHIRYTTILEILGKPKEHVEKTIKEYVQKLKEEDNYMVISEKFSDTKEKDKMFTTFVELEMVAKGMEPLVDFCFTYMPSSLDISKPEKFNLPNNFISGMMNDLQAKLHNVDMVAKKLRTENDFLKVNLNRAIKNYIIIIIKMKERQFDEISRLTGINEKDLEPFLNQMIRDNELKKEGDIYSSKNEPEKEG